MKHIIVSLLAFTFIQETYANGLASVADQAHIEVFHKFMGSFGKVYSTEEEYNQRSVIFKENMVMYEARNKADRAAGGTAIHGITMFSDMTQAEFMANKMLGVTKIPATQSFPYRVSESENNDMKKDFSHSNCAMFLVCKSSSRPNWIERLDRNLHYSNQGPRPMW